MAKKKQKQPEKKSSPTFAYALLTLLVIAALVVFISLNKAPEKPIEKLPSAGEFVKLDKPTTYEAGKVKIIEILKFDCPHCYDLHKNMPQILKKYGDNVTITYVPIVWPKQSTKSIEAYIIAEEMGKGEEMQDALFESQALYQARSQNGMDIMESVPAIEIVAARIGLGADFNSKLESGYARNAALENLKIMRDYNVEVVGTPLVIMNGNLKVNHTVSNLDMVIGSLLS
ncbi:Thioredoxin [uncultured archaeon]|nr:Thioredoxin [uncultured archaeon]